MHDQQEPKAAEPVDDHLVRRDKFARFIGLELESVVRGQARVRMVIRPEHCNGLNIVHGGAIFTLADYAFAAACNAHGIPSVGLQVNIVFLKAVKGPEEGAMEVGALTAVAQAMSHGKIGQYEVRVTDDAGELIALFHGLSYQKGKPVK